jgi:hypothetical protein
MRNLLFRTVCAALCLSVLLGSTGLFAGLREAAAAGATRVAVVTSLKGDVQVKKSGGAKFFSAFTNMSLNEGDLITTGKNSSVVLELASNKADQDSITIGENSQVHFTKLKEDTGTKAKMSVWAGSLWVKVKSISNADDTFEVETPTAIMGVRGTHFVLVVDPLTGKTAIVVASGVMAANSTQAAGDGAGTGPKNEVHIYPTQQLELETGVPLEDKRALIMPVDPVTLVFTLPSEIIEAMVNNMADIVQENAELAQQLAGSVGQGVAAPDPNANLLLVSSDDLEAYSRNMSALIAVVLAEAVNQGVMSEEEARILLDQVNANIQDPQRRFSLDDVPEYRKDFGIDPALKEKSEKARKEQEEKRREKEQRRQEQLEKNSEKSEQIIENKRKQEEANQAAKSEREKEAVDRYKQSLSEEEKAALEQREQERKREKQQEQQEQQGQTGGGTGPGTGGPSPNPGTTPSPQLAASISDYNDYVKTIDIKLSGFTGNRAVFGYQVDLEYQLQHFSFAAGMFMDLVVDGLSPFRNLENSPFKPELYEKWASPEGYKVNAVDRVDYGYHAEKSTGWIRYVLLKFEEGAEAVDNQTVVVRLPFYLYAYPEDVGKSVPVTIKLQAVDANGNIIEGVQPVTVQFVIDKEYGLS